jgi:hypothetical protein
LPLIAFALLSLACSDTRTRTFSLAIKNDSSRPITIGLTKNGPPFTEMEWYSPEDLAIARPQDTMMNWGTVVPPNKTAFIDNYKGEFLPQTSAILRVYAGDMPLSDLLAISRDSRARKDVRLEEGKSTYVVSDRGPYIDAFRTGFTPAGDAAKETPKITTTP